MGSSRFPGKPLAKICGRPMIEHVYRRCRMNPALAGVYIATCDREIAAATEAFGGTGVITSSLPRSARDGVAEAAAQLDADVVGMDQGADPVTHPRMIPRAVERLRHAPA